MAKERLNVAVLPEGAIRFSIETLAGQNLETVIDSISGLMLGTEARRKIKTAPASEESRTREFIALNSRTMELPDYPTTGKVFSEALKYGDKVTVEEAVIIAKGVAKKKIPLGADEVLVMVMDTFAGSHGDPLVLCVGRRRDGLWLYADYAYPGFQWDPDAQFVVSSRK